MSVTNLCRLCVKYCGPDARNLYDAIGQPNEIYEIAIKYFHPMFLNVDQRNECTVMCSQCWQHIFSFHTFQQMVFEAQRKILVEETDIDIQTSMGNESVSTENANVFEPAMNSDDETMSLPDLKIIDYLSSYCNNQQYCEDLGDLHNNSQPLITNIPNGTLTVSESTTSPDCRNSVNEIDRHQSAQSKIKSLQENVDMDRVLAIWRPTMNCEICAKSCESFKLLRYHFAYVHSEVPFYIKCCGRTFNYPSKIEEHALAHVLHNNCQSWTKNVPNDTSTVCESTTSPDCRNSVNDLDRHQSAQSKIKSRQDKVDMDRVLALWRPTMNCEICYKSCESFKLLRHHFASVHSEVPFYISCCGRTFNYPSKIAEHARAHIDPTAFRCQICGACLSSKATLRQHNRLIHSSSKVQSNIYQQRKIPISTKISYAQVDAVIAQYMPRLQCILCNGTYADYPLLKAHFTQHHPGEEFYVKCCLRKFPTRSKLKEHISLHLDPDAFKCNKCGKRSTSYTNLQIHCLRIHSKQRQSVNRVSFKTYDNLIAQWKPKLECNICYQTCPTFTRLQKHFRTQHHFDEFRVVCCQQKFYTRPPLVEHLRLHSNPDAFRCQICNKSYKFQASYVDHVRLRHPGINLRGLFNG